MGEIHHMAFDFSRLSSSNCPAARALRLRARLAYGRLTARKLADALVKRLVRVENVAGAVTRKLRPGATRPVEGHDLDMRADPLPEPPWQEEGEGALSASLVALVATLLVATENLRRGRVRPPAIIRARSLPSVCLTPRLLPVPAASRAVH